MDLSVSKFHSNINTDYSFRSSQKNQQIKIRTNKLNNHKQLDKSRNGKFDFSQALKNFGKGIASPITGMFSSVKNFVIGVGMVAGTLALVAATGGAAAPILIAAGFVMGVVQGIKAVSKIANAKNGDDVEKAFYDVGRATSTIGLSFIGARSSLTQAGIDSEGLSVVASMKKSFSSSKDLIVDIFNVFKTGHYKINLTNAKQVIFQPKIFRQYAKNLSRDGQAEFNSSFDALKDIFPKKYQTLLKGRSKGERSIYEKIIREKKHGISHKINKIKNDKKLSQQVKQKRIQVLEENRNKILKDEQFVKSIIEDLYGARLTLEDVNTQSIDELVSTLEKAIKKGDIELLEIENYRGMNKKYNTANEFYFSQEQINRLKDVSGTCEVKNATKPFGYTAAQLLVKPKNGKVIELQIRGTHVDELADWEHIPYDLRLGKDISRGNNKLGILLRKVRKAIKKMDEEQYSNYQKYIYDNYIYAQAQELGKDVIKPILPEGIDPILEGKNLKKLHDISNNFVSGGVKNPLNIKPELSIIAGVNSN